MQHDRRKALVLKNDVREICDARLGSQVLDPPQGLTQNRIGTVHDLSAQMYKQRRPGGRVDPHQRTPP